MLTDTHHGKWQLALLYRYYFPTSDKILEYGFQTCTKMKCFTTWQHYYFTLTYITELGSTIKQAMQHIFADICKFLMSQLALFLKFYFYAFFQNLQVSFYLFAKKLESQTDKTNRSIFILPNMSFKVTLKRSRRSFWRYKRLFLFEKKRTLKIRYILFDDNSLLWKFVIVQNVFLMKTLHCISKVKN